LIRKSAGVVPFEPSVREKQLATTKLNSFPLSWLALGELKALNI